MASVGNVENKIIRSPQNQKEKMTTTIIINIATHVVENQMISCFITGTKSILIEFIT